LPGPILDVAVSWRIAGRYLEACNCDAICPCRRIGGVPGGRSTHGVCFGALSWLVDDGEADGLDLAGVAAVLTFSYDDDAPGSPWRLILHVDDRADERRCAALVEILLGRRGGPHVLTLPWVRKPSHVLDVRRTRIEIGEGLVRAGDAVLLRVAAPVPTEATVTCIVPGHDRRGRELYTDELLVEDQPFAWELHGTCAYESTFDYVSGA
jgi:hypothetical protein